MKLLYLYQVKKCSNYYNKYCLYLITLFSKTIILGWLIL